MTAYQAPFRGVLVLELLLLTSTCVNSQQPVETTHSAAMSERSLMLSPAEIVINPSTTKTILEVEGNPAEMSKRLTEFKQDGQAISLDQFGRKTWGTNFRSNPSWKDLIDRLNSTEPDKTLVDLSGGTIQIDSKLSDHQIDIVKQLSDNNAVLLDIYKSIDSMSALVYVPADNGSSIETILNLSRTPSDVGQYKKIGEQGVEFNSTAGLERFKTFNYAQTVNGKTILGTEVTIVAIDDGVTLDVSLSPQPVSLHPGCNSNCHATSEIDAKKIALGELQRRAKDADLSSGAINEMFADWDAQATVSEQDLSSSAVQTLSPHGTEPDSGGFFYEVFEVNSPFGIIHIDKSTGQILRVADRFFRAGPAVRAFIVDDNGVIEKVADSNTKEANEATASLQESVARFDELYPWVPAIGDNSQLKLLFKSSTKPNARTDSSTTIRIYGDAYSNSEVIAHELGHIVLWNLGLRTVGRNRDIQEALADVFGIYMRSKVTDKPIIWTAGTSLGCGIERNIAQPSNTGYDRTKPRDPNGFNCGGPIKVGELAVPGDLVCEGDEFCEHVNSTVFSHALYVAATGAENFRLPIETSEGTKVKLIKVDAISLQSVIDILLTTLRTSQRLDWDRYGLARAMVLTAQGGSSLFKQYSVSLEAAFAAAGLVPVSQRLKDKYATFPVSEN